MVRQIAAACDGKVTLPPAKERDSNEVVTITLHAHEDKINFAEQIVMDIARAHDAEVSLCAPATGASPNLWVGVQPHPCSTKRCPKNIAD